MRLAKTRIARRLELDYAGFDQIAVQAVAVDESDI
jgi:hypothetical protein